MASVTPATSFEPIFVVGNEGLQITTGVVLIPDILSLFVPESAGSLVETDLVLPEDARVVGASFGIRARPNGLTRLDSVAVARSATAVTTGSAACTVDLGKLTTIGGVGFQVGNVAPVIARVLRWTGSSWSHLANSGDFPEVAADRLLVESTAAGVDGSDLAEALNDHGTLVLPAVPASLELLVEGTTVWFERQGGASGLTPPAADGGVSFAVERTAAVREAFARAAAAGGQRTVRVSLRAAAAGKLQLTPTMSTLRVHLVQFPPEGISRTTDFTAEGRQRIDVSPPPAAREVREVSLVVRGSFGPERVQPAVGPEPVADTLLALGVGRPLLVGLPAVLADRFAKLTGIRLSLAAAPQSSGGEVGGRLLADDGGKPGAPLPGSELTPLTVPAGTADWRTVALAEPLGLPPTGPVPRLVAAWLELHVSYGEVVCALTGAPPGDVDAPGGPVMRRLAGGGTAGLTTIPALGPLRAALRLVGLPDRDRPIPAVTLGVGRSDVAVGVNPSAEDLPVALTLGSPVRPAEGPVELVATVAATGTLTLDTVRVAYSEGAAT